MKSSKKIIETDNQSINFENEDHSVSVKFDEEGIAKNIVSQSKYVAFISLGEKNRSYINHEIHPDQSKKPKTTK